ncbi:hypothetical protein NLML1_0496 [Candidatus Nanosynbacter lyticus]|nr:hypothetical protein NLML1_0496 [Candidatus Nanosynbacter lyticus]
MESFYVTSTRLNIEMETEPHPSGLVIFSRKLSPDGEPIGHIIVSPKNHHTDVYCDYLKKNIGLISEREGWGVSIMQDSSRDNVAPNYFTRVEPAYGICIPPSDNIPDCPTLLIAETRNKRVPELAHQRLSIDPIHIKMAIQALGIVMENPDILHRTDDKTRLMHFSEDQLNEQSVTIY